MSHTLIRLLYSADGIPDFKYGSADLTEYNKRCDVWKERMDLLAASICSKPRALAEVQMIANSKRAITPEAVIQKLHPIVGDEIYLLRVYITYYEAARVREINNPLAFNF